MTATYGTPVLSSTGLTGTLYNTTPPIMQGSNVTYTGSCTKYTIGGGCDPSEFQCPGCPQINQACSCTLAQKPYYCDPSGATCNYNYTCVRACAQIDRSTSCPGGTYQSVTNQWGPWSALCSFEISDSNYNTYVTNQYNMPTTFTQGMIDRYTVSKYIQAWNNQLYGNPNSIYHQSVDDKITRAYLASQMRIYNPSQGLLTLLSDMTFYPYPVLQDGKYYLQFAVYGNYISDPPSASQVTSYIQAFTGETEGTPYDPALGAGVASPSASNNYIVVDFSTDKVYTQTIPNPSGLGDPFVVGKIYMTPITNLSPVLMYLFDRTYHLTYDTIGGKGLCDMIIAQTGQVPNICYNNTCQSGTFPPACKGIIIQHCQNHTDPKTTSSGFSYDMDQYYVTSNSSDCSCYNTQLPPPINRDQTRFAGMCFTNSCTSGPSSASMMNVFGLTDQACSQNCDNVYNWLVNADPKQRSYMASYLDNGRFQKLCGDIKPTPKVPINYWVLGIGLGITIVCMVGMHIWLRDSSRVWIYLGVVGIILMAISVFLSFDLNGTPYCNGSQQVCKSRYTKITIPNILCSYLLGCECNLINRPCPNNSQECIAGICVTPSSSS